MDDKNKDNNTEIKDETELTEEELAKLSHDEQIDIVAKRILKKYSRAFDELSKK